MMDNNKCGRPIGVFSNQGRGKNKSACDRPAANFNGNERSCSSSSRVQNDDQLIDFLPVAAVRQPRRNERSSSSNASFRNKEDENRSDLEIQKLNSLSDEAILLKLTADRNFLRRLKVPMSNDRTLNVLNIISRATNCNPTYYHRSRNEFLENLLASYFWKSTINDKLVGILWVDEAYVQRNAYRIKKLLLHLISIIVEVLQSVEYKAQELSRAKSVLTKILEKNLIRANTVVYNDEMQKRYNSLTILWHKIFAKKNASADATLSATEKCSILPPNNFRDLPIFPSVEEILINEKPYLRENRVKGEYESVEHYLDVQYRLLREDYIEPLRKGIDSLLHPENYKKPEIEVYEKVFISQPEVDRRAHLFSYRLTFDISGLKRIQWDKCKRFTFASLLCLSSDNFKTLLFATISNRDVQDLKNGQLDVVFELLPADTQLNHNVEYRMVESPSYFEAYRHVLMALGAIRDERDMPFPKYFIKCDSNIESPLYLRSVNPEMDLICLIPDAAASRRSLVCNVLRDSSWPSKETLHLDQPQYDALKLALTKELTIIQGPPGTGKTYLGSKIAEVLLYNAKRWQAANDNSPILVVCYTNHALDQFLEDITSFTENGIIRIGSRSKNPKLEKYLLHNVKHDYRLPQELRSQNFQENNKRLAIERRLAEITRLLHCLDKAPLNYTLLRNIIGNNRILDQIFLNPNRLKVTENDLLNMWLTCDKQAHKNRCPIVLNDLRNLMNATQFGQVECLNALFRSEGDFDKAYIFLLENQSNPELDEPVVEMANFPSIWDIYEIVEQHKFNEEDAVCALQLHHNDVDMAINWLKNGDQSVETVQFGKQMRPQSTAEKNIDQIESDEEYQEFYSDKDDSMSDAGSFYSLPDNSNLLEEIQDWNVVDKDGKTNFPKRVWALIVQSKPFNDTEYPIVIDADGWQLPLRMRWRLYMNWLEVIRATKNDEIHQLQQQYFHSNQKMKEIRSLEQIHIFQQARVLGMTTTGAAKHQAVLNAVKPKIVMIEEAAEVLESHSITSLSSGCQHVILIGDHHQLRPNPSVYELARSYQFDVSLFERLVGYNNFQHAVLKQQHRMRPEIADTLMPHFYDELCNHESVYKYDSVKGITKNIYFFQHTNPETQIGDSTSRQNDFEAKMIVGFCKYLIQQGYTGSQITILCCYAGQMFYIKKFMQDRFSKEDLIALRVTVVDNYQGEECDIILLSFVRSNKEKSIGFLNTENRICVALSRAKIGLYCFGNFKHLASCSPKLWGKIVETLKHKSFYGEHLPLICQTHKNESAVKNFEDFQRLVPEGGCRELCNYSMDCGHACEKFCHPVDQEHKTVKCFKLCLRKCPVGHRCSKQCWDDCGGCSVLVEKILPFCGHYNRVHCYLEVDDVHCQSACKHILSCGHLCQDTCDPVEHTNLCKFKVAKILPCNHKIEVECFKPIEEVLCPIIVEKTLPCNHKLEAKCYQKIEDLRCSVKLSKELTCGHNIEVMCYQHTKDVQCAVKVTKALLCGHNIDVKCCQQSEDMLCNVRVTKTLPCSHKYDTSCYRLVENIRCQVRVEKTWPFCKHTSTTLCSVNVLKEKCKQPCQAKLDCEHICTGNCSSCHNGRLHVKCNKICNKILVCGHQCDQSCTMTCPPCQKLCAVRCVHGGCITNMGRNSNRHDKRKQQLRKCSIPCTECKEPCAWKCPHFECTKKCFEPCNRPRCYDKCPRALNCGHPCIGVCGEPCPKLCRSCNSDEFLCFRIHQTLISDHETKPDTKYIQLPDCGHIFEMERLDAFADQCLIKSTDHSEINQLKCIECNNLILTSFRYRNVVRQQLIDIQAVKKKIQSGSIETDQYRKELIEKIDYQIQMIHSVFNNNSGFAFEELYQALKSYLINIKIYDLTEEKIARSTIIDGLLWQLMNCHSSIEEKFISLNVTLQNNYVNQTAPMSTGVQSPILMDFFIRWFPACLDGHRQMTNEKIKIFLMNENHQLFNLLYVYYQNASKQMIEEILCEISRVNLLIKVIHILKLLVDSMNKVENYNLDDLESIMEILHGSKKISIYLERKCFTYLNSFYEKQEAVPTVFCDERMQILNPVNMHQGHWYKCQYGHVYCFTDDDRASREARCPEC